MINGTNNEYPKLRALDIRPVMQDGRQVFLLRDPLQLSDKILAVPRQLGPALALCDGTRDRAGLRSALITQYQVLVGPQVLNQLIDACDEALLLDNERAEEARALAEAEYRAAPFRTPALAGQSYPADPDELRGLLDDYLSEQDDVDETGAGRGLLSPHIDFDRGGAVYARVWKRAAQMARQADLAIILGTDHYSERTLLTLTRQNYATPYGVLPTPRNIVDALAAAIGEETAFAGELHHRAEHSVELAAVWLHHIRKGEPIEVVPVLCGGFSHFVSEEADLESDPTINAFVDTLRRATKGRRALVVSAGDLSHVGPAFGGAPMGLMERARLRVADDEIMAQLSAGDADGFFAAIQKVDDRNNVCGLPPTYIALRLMGNVEGDRVAYDRCPADENNTSFVTIGGVVFRDCPD